jgi:hypothetical protein
MEKINLDPTNHLTAETTSAWIIMIMGGYFHNSARGDLPTRVLRIYFASMDEYVLREGATDPGHDVNLAGFDETRYPMCVNWNRNTSAYLKGFQIRDLKSFIWRAGYRGHRFEIHAKRIDGDRWLVEYRSDCENSAHELEMVEYGPLLRDWFMMIDPETLEVIKAETLISLTSAAGEASQMVNSAVCSGYHPQMFEQLKAMTAERGVDASKCWGASYVCHGAPEQAKLAKWWLMMLELPPEEDQPTFREGFDVEHAWNLHHSDILARPLR